MFDRRVSPAHPANQQSVRSSTGRRLTAERRSGERRKRNRTDCLERRYHGFARRCGGISGH